MGEESDKLKRWAEMFGVAVALACCGAIAYSGYTAYFSTVPNSVSVGPSTISELERRKQANAPDVGIAVCDARPTGVDPNRKGFSTYEVNCSGSKTDLTVDQRAIPASK